MHLAMNSRRLSRSATGSFTRGSSFKYLRCHASLLHAQLLEIAHSRAQSFTYHIKALDWLA